MPVYIVLFFSPAVIVFNIFDSNIEIFWKKYSFALHLVETEMDPDPLMPIPPDLNAEHRYLDCFDTHLGFLHLRLHPVPELEIPLLFISALLSHAPLFLAQKLC